MDVVSASIMKFRMALFASCLCLLNLGSQAANPALSESKPGWSVDDVLQWEWGSDFKLSPDCHSAAWVKGVPDKEKNEWVGNLFLSSLSGTNEVQLTRSLEGCSSPKWSPDGRLLAFISWRPAPSPKPDTINKAQLWLINPFGGEPWPLTQSERAISDFDWAGTNRLVYSAQEDPSQYKQSNKDKKETSQVVEDELHEPPVRLFATDLEGKNVTRLTQNTDRIVAFWVSQMAPGRWLFTLAAYETNTTNRSCPLLCFGI
jgi:dipeptidyl aminopeptidase/acylaminoacyl peptidase